MNSIDKKLRDVGNFERTAASLNTILEDVTDVSLINSKLNIQPYEGNQTRQCVSFSFLLYSESSVKEDTFVVEINRSVNFSNYNKPLEAEKLTIFDSNFLDDFFAVYTKNGQLINQQLIQTKQDYFFLELLTDQHLSGTLNFDGLRIKITEELNATN